MLWFVVTLDALNKRCVKSAEFPVKPFGGGIINRLNLSVLKKESDVYEYPAVEKILSTMVFA